MLGNDAEDAMGQKNQSMVCEDAEAVSMTVGKLTSQKNQSQTKLISVASDNELQRRQEMAGMHYQKRGAM